MTPILWVFAIMVTVTLVCAIHRRVQLHRHGGRSVGPHPTSFDAGATW